MEKKNQINTPDDNYSLIFREKYIKQTGILGLAAQPVFFPVAKSWCQTKKSWKQIFTRMLGNAWRAHNQGSMNTPVNLVVLGTHWLTAPPLLSKSLKLPCLSFHIFQNDLLRFCTYENGTMLQRPEFESWFCHLLAKRSRTSDFTSHLTELI